MLPSSRRGRGGELLRLDLKARLNKKYFYSIYFFFILIDMKTYHNNFYNKKLLDFARELRSERPTKGERRIWKALLCKKQSSIRFLRQRPIDQFIVDFFAPELGLIIEIDGSSHFYKQEYDNYRQNKLEKLGFTVIRFTEGEVLNQLDDVQVKLLHAIHCLKE